MLCRFFNFPVGIDELSTTDLSSPNMCVGPGGGTPKCRKVFRMSTICSTQVRAAENSDPHADVSTAACFLECVWMTNPFGKWKVPLHAFPVVGSCWRLASTQQPCVTGFPRGSGTSPGINSVMYPQTEWFQSHSNSGSPLWPGNPVRTRCAANRIFNAHPKMRLTRSRCPTRGATRKEDMDTTAVRMSNRPMVVSH